MLASASDTSMIPLLTGVTICLEKNFRCQEIQRAGRKKSWSWPEVRHIVGGCCQRKHSIVNFVFGTTLALY